MKLTRLLLFIILFTGCKNGQDSSSLFKFSGVKSTKLNKKWDKFPSKRKNQNVFYDWSKKLAYDVYAPANSNNTIIKIIFFVHSGAFVTGSNQNKIITKLAQDFTRTGEYICIVPNYSIVDYSESASWLSMLSKTYVRKTIVESTIDIKKAIRHYIQNYTTAEMETEIYLVGYSAGGIITNNILFLNSDEAKNYIQTKSGGWIQSIQEELELKDEIYKLSDEILLNEKIPNLKGVVSISSGVFDTYILNDTDITTPLLLIHGDKDKIIPYHSGKPFSQFNKDIKIPLINFYTDLGINDTTIESKVKTGPIIPSEWIKVFTSYTNSDLCGSKCMENYLLSTPNIILHTIEDGSHTFMLNEFGSFSKEYTELRNTIYNYINNVKFTYN